MSRDPIGYRAGVNLVEYVWGSPINRNDPAGLQSVTFPGTATIYPTPTGTFDLQVALVKITNPKQQKQLGTLAKGFVVSYNPAKGVCQRPCEKLSLTQAWTTGWGLGRYGPALDGTPVPGWIYPPYDKPMPGVPNSFYDRPFKRSFTYRIWELTVCAICTTTLTDASGRWKTVIQQVLGCISFKWEDRLKSPVLIHGDDRYEYPSSETEIPAVIPSGFPWEEAKGKHENRPQ